MLSLLAIAMALATSSVMLNPHACRQRASSSSAGGRWVSFLRSASVRDAGSAMARLYRARVSSSRERRVVIYVVI